MTTVLLVRHGETTWNREGHIQGWAPTSLTDRGRRQARVVGRHVAAAYDVDRMRASDLARTRETARLVAREVGVEPVFDRAWRERDFGVYQGFDYEALFEGFPEFAVDEVGYRAVEATPEGGESVLDLRERVLAGWDDLLADAERGDVVLVVTHGGPLCHLLGHLKGLDPVASIIEQSPDNCAISEVRVERGEPTVVVENDTACHERAADD
jgi:probable phosphoglycerate mutase